MRLFFDRKFRFSGYSQTPQELFDGYSRFAGMGCAWIVVTILGPFTGIGMLLWLKKKDREAAVLRAKGRKGPYAQPISKSDYALAYFYIFVGLICWFGVYCNLRQN